MKKMRHISCELISILISLTLVSCTSSVSLGDKSSTGSKIENATNTDVDGDGILNEEDNCPTLANPDQLDSDRNGKGDVCEDLSCESNFCQDGDHLSGYFCDGDASIRCGLNEEIPGCLKEVARSDCSFGCQTAGVEAGLCDAPPPDLTSPEVASLDGATINGGTATLAGDNFGTHALDLTSGVGPNGWIEKNAAGTYMEDLVEGGRATGQGWGDGVSTRVSSFIEDSPALVRTGSHSVNASVDYDRDGDWQKDLNYFKPDTFKKIYASWYVYFRPQHINEWIQWKEWYISPINNHDRCGKMSQISYWEGNASQLSSLLTTLNSTIVRCSYDDYLLCYEDIIPVPFYEPVGGIPYNYQMHVRGGAETMAENHIIPAQWARVDLYAESSDVDVSNGRFEYYVTREGQRRKHIDTWTNVRTRLSDCGDEILPPPPPADPWKYFGLQGYLVRQDGPPPGATQLEIVDLFYDDIYIQFGTKARVELGNQPSYDDCSQLEIQTPKSWSSSQIEFDVNHGKFQTGNTVYVFVVREDGKVSGGFPITLQ